MKIGTLSQKPAQVLANLETALPEVVKHIKGGWDNVQSLFIKTNSSAALPIWQCDLGTESGGRWEGLVASAGSAEGESDEDEKMDVEQAPVTRAKGKKRAAEEAEKEEDKPKKRSKATDKANEASPAPAAEPAPTSSEPAKKKRRKSAAEPATAPTPAVAEESSDAPVDDKKRKRRKSQVCFRHPHAMQ